MKNTTCLFGLAAMLTIFSCKKSDDVPNPGNNPVNPPSGATCNKFCAKINGTLYQLDSVTAAQFGIPNALFVTGQSKGLLHSINFMVNPFNGVGEYDSKNPAGLNYFSQYISQIIGTSATNPIATHTATELKVKITEYDAAAKTISGTFEGKYRQNGSSVDVIVNEGQFKKVQIID